MGGSHCKEPCPLRILAEACWFNRRPALSSGVEQRHKAVAAAGAVVGDR